MPNSAGINLNKKNVSRQSGSGSTMGFLNCAAAAGERKSRCYKTKVFSYFGDEKTQLYSRFRA
jgi:hypothetical protein